MKLLEPHVDTDLHQVFGFVISESVRRVKEISNNDSVGIDKVSGIIHYADAMKKAKTLSELFETGLPEHQFMTRLLDQGDGRNRQTGRSTLMAYTYIKLAVQSPDWIEVVDHFPGQDARINLMDKIQRIISEEYDPRYWEFEPTRIKFNNPNQSNKQ